MRRVIGTTTYLCRGSLFFMILLYRRLRWRTEDIVKQIPITLYHRLIPGQHEKMAFSRRSLYIFILSSINCWRTRCIDQQQQQSVASAILATSQQSVRNTTTLGITPTFWSASVLFVGIFNMRSWKMDGGPIYTERFFGAAMKKTDNPLFLVLRFLKATPFGVFILYFYGLACFVVFSCLAR